METLKLIKIKKIKGTIKVETGLHIGAGNDKIEIGGMDNPIIRDPSTGNPYIPGSSLKGKIRSLMEWRHQKVVKNNGNPCSCGEEECVICRVFGTSAGSKNKTEENEKAKRRGPTRVIFRDAQLTEDWIKKVKEGVNIIEDKSENSLNRITAEANPRPIERIIPGVEFDFELLYKVLDMGDGGKTDEKYFNYLLEGLGLLENDYLGGGGSRGSGKISFHNLSYEDGGEVTLPEVK